MNDEMSPPGATKPKKPRGFAAMDRALVSAIARKGGKAAHAQGVAHEFSTDEAREAGRLGGRATHVVRRRAAKEATEEPQSPTAPGLEPKPEGS